MNETNSKSPKRKHPDNTDPFCQLVGSRIRALRLRKGFSLRAFGTTIQTNPWHLMAIEHGRTAPTVAILSRIARGLGVRSTDLLRSPKPSLVEKFYATLGRRPKLVPIAKHILSARPS